VGILMRGFGAIMVLTGLGVALKPLYDYWRGG
jgi:hypothetical protein